MRTDNEIKKEVNNISAYNHDPWSHVIIEIMLDVRTLLAVINENTDQRQRDYSYKHMVKEHRESTHLPDDPS